MLLTIWREVHLALAREEVVALALAAELGRELLSGDLLEGDVLLLWDLATTVVLHRVDCI